MSLLIGIDDCKDSLGTLLSSEDILGAGIYKTRELLLEDEDREDFDLPQSAEILLRLEGLSFTLRTGDATVSALPELTDSS